VQPELAVDQGDRGEEVEAVIGRLARLRIDAAGVVLLALQRGVSAIATVISLGRSGSSLIC
jgi:hypothetical protein